VVSLVVGPACQPHWACQVSYHVASWVRWLSTTSYTPPHELTLILSTSTTLLLTSQLITLWSRCLCFFTHTHSFQYNTQISKFMITCYSTYALAVAIVCMDRGRGGDNNKALPLSDWEKCVLGRVLWHRSWAGFGWSWATCQGEQVEERISGEWGLPFLVVEQWPDQHQS
jgi:hypothetical protein